MKTRLLIASLAATLLLPILTVTGADSAAAQKEPSTTNARKEPSPTQKELQTVVGKISAKMKEGKKTESDFADELKEFDALIAKHKDEHSDDVAQIHMMKAMFYSQVVNDPKKGDELKLRLVKDFPESSQAKQIESMMAAEKIKSGLVVGAKFPDFVEKDLHGKPMSIGNYKGKVVLVDFWATWCGPCIAELPNVLSTYEKHHKVGFEIVGISLDESEQKLKDFIQKKNMPWQQYFDGKGWQSKLGGKYGVNSIPATYLLDRTGTIIGKDLRGDALETAVVAALAKH